MPRRRGFTLIELLVALVITLVALSATGAVLLNGQRDMLRQRGQRRAEEAVRTGIMIADNILRATGSNPAAAVFTALTPDYVPTGSFNNVRVRADRNGDGDVADQYEDVRLRVRNDSLLARWTATAATDELVAFPVRSLLFEYFDANRVAVTLAANIGNARLVRVTVSAPRADPAAPLLRRTLWVDLRNLGI